MLTRNIVRFCAELIKSLCLAWSARCIPCVAVLQAGKLSRHALEMWLPVSSFTSAQVFMEQVPVPGPSSYRLDNPAPARELK